MGLASRLIAMLFIATLAACGGGGGGNSGGGGGDPSAGRFTLLTQTINASAYQGSDYVGGGEAYGTVSGATGTVYVYIDLSSSTLVSDSNVFIDGDTGTLELWGVNPNTLSAGVHTETIPIRVCADAACNRHLAGSPASLTFRYEILPDPAVTDSDNDGVVDLNDAFPNDSSETTDSDGDTIGDNADPDDDNDGVNDEDDDAPFDSSISANTTTLHFNVSGEGSVLVDGVPVDCSDGCTVEHNNQSSDSVTLGAAAGDNYSIGDWMAPLDCLWDGLETCTLATRFLKELTVELAFTENPYATVVIDSDNGGVIEATGGLSCQGHCEIKVYTYTDASFTLKTAPAPGYTFSGWNGACDGSEPCDITVNSGESISVSASYTDTGLSANLCSGTAVTTGSGTDNLTAIGPYLPLCNGQVLLAETLQNRIIWRDIVNATTIDEFQLTASPRYLALDEENKLLYVSHGQSSFISRVDLATGEVVQIFVQGGANSLAVGPDGDLFVGSYPLQILNSRYATGVDVEAEIWGSALTYNDATNRLITSTTNYYFDTETKTLTEQGPSNAGGSGADCNYVVVSPDGDHGAMPCGGGNGAGYTIYDFDSNDPTVLYGEWDTGAYPSGAAFSPSSLYAWLTNYNQLQLFSVETHALIVAYPQPNCSYSDTRRMAVSTDGNVLLGLTQCGFDNDTAIMSWYYYDTSVAP